MKWFSLVNLIYEIIDKKGFMLVKLIGRLFIKSFEKGE